MGEHRIAACTPSAIGHFIQRTPRLNDDVYVLRQRLLMILEILCGERNDDERTCSICVYGAAEIHPVRHVTLQTRLRRQIWADTEAFRAFINDRIVHVEINVCRNCLARCNIAVRQPGIIAT